MSRHGKMLDALDKDEKKTISKCGKTSFKGWGLTLISESGLYKLVLRSNKPEAKDFKPLALRTG